MHNVESLSVAERLVLLVIGLRLPFHVISAVLLRVKHQHSKRSKKKSKSLSQIIDESSSRVLTDLSSPRQLQFILGTTERTYRKWAKTKWAKENGVKLMVENVGGVFGEEGAQGAKLLWLTEENRERVLVYVHGGGYVVPMTEDMIKFCPGLRDAYLAGAHKEGGVKDFGIVALVYSLYPAAFPTQLSQLILALKHLISRGTSPSNIILLGDSAGANIIIQFLLHSMYPVPLSGVPLSPLSPPNPPSYYFDEREKPVHAPYIRLGGVILLSPWLSLDTRTPSHSSRSDSAASLDFVSARTLFRWGEGYMSGVPRDCLEWVKPLVEARSLNFINLASLTPRILITAGSGENLLHDAESLYILMREQAEDSKLDVKLDVRLDVEAGGVHEEPIFDVAHAKGGKGSRIDPRAGLSEATMRIVEWIRGSFDGGGDGTA